MRGGRSLILIDGRRGAERHANTVRKKKGSNVRERLYEELAKKVFEEEQARFNVELEARFKAEQEQERIDFETALELQNKLDEREEWLRLKKPHDIDWSDTSVLRYHDLQINFVFLDLSL
ncbi:hypothetical protein Tco_1474966 [Tanacetum coccineum]